MTRMRNINLKSVLAKLDTLSAAWTGPVDAVALVRADRRRNR